MSPARSILLLLIICTINGCGSLHNNQMALAKPDPERSYRFYGGVKRDLEVAGDQFRDTVQGAHSFPAQVYHAAVTSAFLAVDLPLSAVADTVLLPYTTAKSFGQVMEQTSAAPKGQVPRAPQGPQIQQAGGIPKQQFVQPHRGAQ